MGENMANKLKVGILGGTGMVGQRFVALLEDHPFFELTTIAASKNSAGKKYGDIMENRWKIDLPIPKGIKETQ